MKTWSAFLLHDELDMLNVRLDELDWCAGHVVAQASQTYRGQPREWVDLPASCLDLRIDLPHASPWDREHFQRDALMAGLRQVAAPDDLVLIGDVDEFPPRDLAFMAIRDGVRFEMDICMYAVDWMHPSETCSPLVLCRAGWLFAQEGVHRVRAGADLPTVRGGLHLSWLGAELQRSKLKVSLHMDESCEPVASGRSWSEGLHQSGEFHLLPVDVDERWPRAIQERRCPPDWFRPR